jgi:hypothetical protein
MFAQSAPAQDGSAASLLATTRAAMKAGNPDAEIARTLSAIRLTERLDDAVVEQLQTEGVGAETLDALDWQQERSRQLPKPAAALHLFDAPPPPAAEERTAILESAREAALKYTAGLPNFLCTETVHRYADPKKTQSWALRDWFTLSMAYANKREQYKLASLSGKPTTKDANHIGGTISHGEFGGVLSIFEPSFATQFQWERWSLLRGRLVSVFSYFVDQPHSKYTVHAGSLLKSYRMNPATRGFAYVDRETRQVLRMTVESVGLPPNWPILRTFAAVDFEFTDIGGKQFVLPRHALTRLVLKDGPTRNLMEFSDYRKFTGETTVTFDK